MRDKWLKLPVDIDHNRIIIIGKNSTFFQLKKGDETFNECYMTESSVARLIALADTLISVEFRRINEEFILCIMPLSGQLEYKGSEQIN